MEYAEDQIHAFVIWDTKTQTVLQHTVALEFWLPTTLRAAVLEIV
jgi:hypothetical protein